MMVIIKDGNASCWKMDIYMIWLCSHTDELIMLMGTQSSDDQLIFGCNMVMCIAVMQSIAPPPCRKPLIVILFCWVCIATYSLELHRNLVNTTEKDFRLGHYPFEPTTLPPYCDLPMLLPESLIVALDEYPHIPCPHRKA